MKKYCLLVFVFVLTFPLFACEMRLDLKDYMSEITQSYFSAENEFVDGSICVGEREKNYIIDGKSGENTPFSLVSLAFKQKVEDSQIVVELSVNDEKSELVLYYNPATGVFINDLGYALNDDDIIKIEYESILLEFKRVDFAVGYDDALAIAKKELSSQIKSNVKGGKLVGECYLKVLSSKQNASETFWLFTIVTTNDEHINLLINTQNGQIIKA